MQNTSIVKLIEERLEKGDIDLPVFHRLALKIQHLISKDDYNAIDLANIIKQDQALVSNILKVANSSFYGGLKAVTTIRDATVRLGGKSIMNLVMVATQRQLYQSRVKEITSWMNPLWSHSLGTAMAGRWLALHLGLNKLAEESFLAGLMHDIGKLLILKIIEELQNAQSIPKDIPRSVIEDILVAMHCAQGERLMRNLNMPRIYYEVVAMHHDDGVTAENVIVNLVKLANISCHKLGIGLKHDPGLMLSTSPEAVTLMANDLLLAELQVRLEETVVSVLKVL